MNLIQITDEIAVDPWSVQAVFIETFEHTSPPATGSQKSYSYKVIVSLEHEKLVARHLTDHTEALRILADILAKLRVESE